MRDRARMISVASVMTVLPMHVPHLPERGAAVTAEIAPTLVGGAFVVMDAAVRQGVPVVNLCPLGTGANSMMVRRALHESSIESHAAEVVGDTGMKLVLVEEEGYYTSVVSPGVEAGLQLESLRSCQVSADDYVYLSAADLVMPSYRDVVVTWLKTLPEETNVVLEASPLVDHLRPEDLHAILPFVSVFSANERESSITGQLLGMRPCDKKFRDVLRGQAIVVRRVGRKGAVAFDDEHPQGIGVPSVPTHMVDTLGVGATHTGVLIAGLLQGRAITDALRRANLAAATAIGTAGNIACPTNKEIDALLATHV